MSVQVTPPSLVESNSDGHRVAPRFRETATQPWVSLAKVISQTVEAAGTIARVFLVPPRGAAFVTVSLWFDSVAVIKAEPTTAARTVEEKAGPPRGRTLSGLQVWPPSFVAKTTSVEVSSPVPEYVT